jgi:predicted RNase H-like nuclease (RuvC/YqgF family)
MTDSERKAMKAFDAKVRQLIKEYVQLKSENDELYSELERKDQEIEALRKEVDSCKQDYETLKLAKMISISDSEHKSAKQRITQLVRDVNKCIALLTQEEQQQANS